MDAEGVAIDRARKLAKKLGHAAVIARRGKTAYGSIDAFDSWVPLGEGWTAIALVSVTGKVVAQAQE